MHRLRVGRLRTVHRRLALWAGLVTLVVAGVGFWYTIEALGALAQAGGGGEAGELRFAELGLMLGCLFMCVGTVFWLKVSPSLSMFAAHQADCMHRPADPPLSPSQPWRSPSSPQSFTSASHSPTASSSASGALPSPATGPPTLPGRLGSTRTRARQDRRMLRSRLRGR